MSTIVALPLARIRAGDNDRKQFRKEELQTLAASMARQGLAQPITVRPLDGGYQIVAGERRFRAAKLLGWESIPAIVRELSDHEASSIMLAENTARVDLDPMEEARAYARRHAEGQATSEIAETAGVSHQLVKSRLALLGLYGELQNAVSAGRLPVGHAEVLASQSEEVQSSAFRVFLRSPTALSLPAFKDIVYRMAEAGSQAGLFELEAEIVQVVESHGPDRGKAALGDSEDKRWPEVRMESSRESLAKVFERFVLDLEAAGETDAALAARHLYTGLVRLNYVKKPLGSQM